MNTPRKSLARSSLRWLPVVALCLLGATGYGCGGQPPVEPGDGELTDDEGELAAEDAIVASSAESNLIFKPIGCIVQTKELMITDLSVVEDPLRTAHTGSPYDARTGAWTFARLMKDMAPAPSAAPAFVESLFQSWISDQTVNGLTVAARPAIQQTVLDGWPRSQDGSLDLKRAPLRLLAIVNRMDLRNLDEGNAGQGRFVFGVLSPEGFPLPFTVIIEYLLPASTEADVLDWARAWHQLGRLPVPSEDYNAALQAITQRFTGRNAMPGRPNGSALSQLRTNEIALAPVWELREFTLSSQTGSLQPATVKLTPDLPFNGTSTLADFINENEEAILGQEHTVPETLLGAPFLAGSAINDFSPSGHLTRWEAPGIHDNDARHLFSLNTCNGCHGDETQTFFLHVGPREQGQPAPLSGFLTGIEVPDPVTGELRVMNDLQRRRSDLRALLCPGPLPLDSADARSAEGASVRKGIGRVH